MTKRARIMSFRQQMRRSMADLRAIVTNGQSPSGDGRFTVRTVQIQEPSKYSANAIRRLRERLELSQTLFAKLIGVSASLIRAWELGAREPSPLARRLLDQVDANPAVFAAFVSSRPLSQKSIGDHRRRVA